MIRARLALLPLLVFFSGVALAPGPGARGAVLEAGEEAASSQASLSDEVLKSAARVAERGLAWLATTQNEDKSFSVEPGESATRAPLAVTALAALAFMAGGSTTSRGPYAEQVRTSVDFLLQHQEPVATFFGDPRARDVEAWYFNIGSDSTSKMHGHGYATLAVAQAYGTLGLDPIFGEAAADRVREERARMRQALVRAVRLIELSQTKSGGWNYEPGDTDHEGSVTITMIQALRAARDAGVDVDVEVIRRAVKYMHDSQDRETGAFRYQLNSPRTSYALTAAAIGTLNATGDYDSEVIDAGLDYMLRRDPLFHPDLLGTAEAQAFPEYARLYAAQAYWFHRDPRHWQRWYPLVVEQLERQQDDDQGHFRSSDYGRVYSTAMACLVVQVPFQYLPVFQK